MSLRTHFAVIHDSCTFAHPDDRSSCCGCEVDEPIASGIEITCGGFEAQFDDFGAILSEIEYVVTRVGRRVAHFRHHKPGPRSLSPS